MEEFKPLAVNNKIIPIEKRDRSFFSSIVKSEDQTASKIASRL